MLPSQKWIPIVLIAVACTLVGKKSHAGQFRAESGRIDSLCNKIDAFVKDNEESAIIVANTADDTAQVPHWQRFGSDSLRQSADSGENLNENAVVWTKNGAVVFVEFTFQSPSRDWAQYVSYYYRDNGSLALAYSSLRSFYGDVDVKRAYWFTETGTVLDSSFYVSDLGSGRPITEQREYNDESVRQYLHSSDLPFKSVMDR